MKMTDSQMEQAMRMLERGNTLQWQGWIIKFDWADGYIADRKMVNGYVAHAEAFDDFPTLAQKMFEIDSKEKANEQV